MILSKVAIVIPNHREDLDDLEKILLAQVRKVLGHYPIIFAGPEGKTFSYLEPGDSVVYFPKKYFQTLRGYNNLSISPLFYEPFLDFNYILIYQLDAFVFYDALEDFCRLDYDYIGAAWPYHAWSGKKIAGKTPRVGNGGFCLRKVKACHELLKEVYALPGYKNPIDRFTEDTFFSISGTWKSFAFKVAPVAVANLFAMEWYPDRHVKKLGGELPFGCHNWTKFSADFYVKLFAQLGYDLQPFRAQMQTDDYERYYPFNLKQLTLKRLIRRVNCGQSIFKYLPTKNFASVRVVKSFGATKILYGLLVEENSLADKIFTYDEENLQDLIRDLNREPLPHLIIAISFNDEPLIQAIEDKGLIYGEHFILFQHEYMKLQEELFHNLGR